MDKTPSPLSALADAGLLRRDAFINGQWSGADERFAVRDPATGQTLAEVANTSLPQVQAAIAAAEAVWPAWRSRPAKERSALMMKWFALVMQHTEDLARLMTAEQGKPLAESRGEVAYGASFIEWFAEEGRRVYGEVVPTTDATKRFLVLKQAIGVCAAIESSTFCGIAFTMSVPMNPGATQFTRMLNLPSSRDQVFVKLITPAFVAA